MTFRDARGAPWRVLRTRSLREEVIFVKVYFYRNTTGKTLTGSITQRGSVDFQAEPILLKMIIYRDYYYTAIFEPNLKQ